MANTTIALDNATQTTYCTNFDRYLIYTIVTSDSSIASRWISTVEETHPRHLRPLMVGLHVEWRPSRSQNSHNLPASLHLCFGHHCLIFQLFNSNSILASLLSLLSNPNNVIVGIGINQELQRLEEYYPLRVTARAVDVRALAVEFFGRNDYWNADMKLLANIVLHAEVEVPPAVVTSTRWDVDRRNLSIAQVEYAILRVFVSFEVHTILNLRI